MDRGYIVSLTDAATLDSEYGEDIDKAFEDYDKYLSDLDEAMSQGNEQDIKNVVSKEKKLMRNCLIFLIKKISNEIKKYVSS